MTRSHKVLVVWQKSLVVVKTICRLTSGFPKEIALGSGTELEARRKTRGVLSYGDLVGYNETALLLEEALKMLNTALSKTEARSSKL